MEWQPIQIKLFLGKKTFSNIHSFTTTNGIPGGHAINIQSLRGTFQTRLHSVNSSYSTDFYYPQFNGIDTLVSTASTATLQNKTLSTTPFNCIVYENSQNKTALVTQTNYISMNHNPIF